MKKQTAIFSALLLVRVVAAQPVMGGPAVDALYQAAGAADSRGTFDGSNIANNRPDLDITLSASSVELNSLRSAGRGVSSILVPVAALPDTEGEFPASRVNDGVALDPSTEKPALDRAIAKLAAIKSVDDLSAFLKSEGVEVKWKSLGSLNSDPDYASACIPEVCKDKKVIYLSTFKDEARNIDHKKLFLDVNPTFLAVTLAHELTHLSDFKSIGGSPAPKTQAQLFLELNGWSAGVYVYHQLLQSKVAPEPNSPQESRDIQLLRLDLAIRDYVNGGKRPVASDFRQISNIGVKSFEDYINFVTHTPRKGSMSLAGVVESAYDGLDPKFEELQKPDSSASNIDKTAYKQAKKIKKSLDLSTAEYIKWRKKYVDAPTPAPQQPSHTQPHHPQHDDDGGSDDGGDNGGGDDGGAVDVDPGDWHPQPGSGNATWD